MLTDIDNNDRSIEKPCIYSISAFNEMPFFADAKHTFFLNVGSHKRGNEPCSWAWITLPVLSKLLVRLALAKPYFAVNSLNSLDERYDEPYPLTTFNARRDAHCLAEELVTVHRNEGQHAVLKKITDGSLNSRNRINWWFC